MKAPIKFDEYYLIDRVAVGGMAEVFKGITYSGEHFERQMAVKRVLPHIAEDQEFIEMFVDEAKLVSQLQHPNIPQIYHLGRYDQLYFISMEFISGQDLRAIFDRARALKIKLDLGICAHIIMEICEALDYAHRKTNSRLEPLNLIHRDISPQNIIVAYDGTVKLVDFGIAKAAGQINQTQAGILKGKFSYMSPEQARGFTIDARADLFGLGAVLYEISTLERCFLGQSDFSTIERVRNAEYHPPRKARGDLPVPLERIIRKSLAKTIEQRFQSAADFQEALSVFVRRHQLRRSREQVKTFMTSLFAAEIQQEQRRLEEFRQYATEHIPEAQQRHESRRFRRISAEELSHEVSRPRFALRNEMKLSLEQEETGALDISAFNHESYDATGGSDQVQYQRNAKRGLPFSKIIAFVSLALLTGSSTVAFTWLNRALPSSVWVEDLVGWRSQVEVTQQGVKRVLTTPALIDQLPEGEHVLTITAPSGTQQKRSVRLGVGQTLRFNVKSIRDKEFGLLYLSSEPLGAKVKVMGESTESVGVTPLELVLPSNQNNLQIELEGYKKTSLRVFARPDQIVTHHLELLPLKTRWRLITGIVGAEFSIKTSTSNSETWTPLILRGDEVELDNSRDHLLQVKAQGYEPLEFKLSPNASQEATRHLILKSLKTTTVNQLNVVSAIKNESSESLSSSSKQSVMMTNKQPKEQTQNNEDSAKPVVMKRSPKRSPKKNPTPQKYSPNKRRTRRASAPSQPTGQPGFLKLIVFPPAEVFIGGRSVGWTPLINHKLNAGMHQIKLRFRSGEEMTISQNISAGRVSLRRVRQNK